jgi:tRNA(fMet)-specific endonuclease VapC
MWKSRKRFLAIFDVAPFDDAASRRHGAVRAFLKARGTPIGPLDTLIAGHALMLNATVVTNNVGEFARVSGLTVEDWLH